MLNLFEIMQNAQGGNAYQNLANQFGIGPDQARKAVEAVLPAFSMGLQQQTRTMEGWQSVLATLGRAQNSAQFFDSNGDGIPDHLKNEGQNALGAMFGTPETTQAVARQAAQFAGLPAQMMQQMLPVIASMVMGGLFKGAMNGGLGSFLGQPAPTPQQQAGTMLETFFGSFFGGRAPQPQPDPQDPVAAGLDMLKGMFQTGQEVHTAQMEALSQIFQQVTRR
ncbi:MAG: DUF937 domain-containing protein [Methylobacterium sp.]|jgi:hypothetical protein|nr:DUF937 domain-containing protein [Methylobacterium sp.]MCA3601312.1 DUF937 domain-containing protein [Methylobacterium sp.]MCA3605688.1 DUF937 domain-containing protein [Methylobacterium sp.]MCA3608330.1 DUF937 domain-containing protein [Methylobacterium sp.]MCA3610867.1 DUF937 domain-containing protein [Methylobacterium sp.]